MGQHPLVLGQASCAPRFGHLVGQAQAILVRRRQQGLPLRIAREPQHWPVLRREHNPPEVQRDALEESLARGRALDELPIDAVPHAERLLALRVEAHNLTNTARLITSQLVGPISVPSVRRAHDLHRQVRRPALPDLPRVEPVIRRAALHEDVR